MLGLSRIGLALLLLAVATVAGQNPTPVQIRLGLLQSVPLPLGWVVAAALAMGILSSAVIGWLWGKPPQYRRQTVAGSFAAVGSTRNRTLTHS
ncbi:MAG: LapA family protein [Thermostichales cyanobacterium BF3_bins_165]